MTPADMLHHLTEPAKHAADAGAVAIAVGTLFAWLPGVASILSVIWLALRIYETFLKIMALRRGPHE